MKIRSLHWNDAAFTCKEKSWRKVTGEYPVSKPPFFYLLRKSMDWFLYDNGLRHERVKDEVIILCLIIFETRRISHLFRSALFTKIIFGFLNNLITSKVR